jgi:glc operon protein GlcG
MIVPSSARPFLAAALATLPAIVGAQQFPAAASAPYPLDVVPDKLPFGVPYGPPITLQRAQAAIQAAEAEAARRGWPLNIAVVDSGANLVAFARMDGAMLASIEIAEHKARAAAKFRRPTKAFEEAIQKSGNVYVTTLDDVVASRGGLPLVENGKIVGAIGCSGGSGSQDEIACMAGAAALEK